VPAHLSESRLGLTSTIEDIPQLHKQAGHLGQR
jgi:hypothetical protein